jgi:hypothetical protein
MDPNELDNSSIAESNFLLENVTDESLQNICNYIIHEFEFTHYHLAVLIQKYFEHKNESFRTVQNGKNIVWEKYDEYDGSWRALTRDPNIGLLISEQIHYYISLTRMHMKNKDWNDYCSENNLNPEDFDLKCDWMRKWDMTIAGEIYNKLAKKSENAKLFNTNFKRTVLKELENMIKV